MNTYLDQPCDRCNSKRKIARKWKEKIPTFSGGTTVVEYTQIICTNKVCQAENEKQLAKEEKKRKEIQVKQEKNHSLQKTQPLKREKSVRKPLFS